MLHRDGVYQVKPDWVETESAGYSDQRWCLGYIANDQGWVHLLRTIIKVFGGSTGHDHTKDKL